MENSRGKVFINNWTADPIQTELTEEQKACGNIDNKKAIYIEEFRATFYIKKGTKIKTVIERYKKRRLK